MRKIAVIILFSLLSNDTSASDASAFGIMYVIRKGDSLNQILETFHINLEDLKEANPKRKDDFLDLQEGKFIRIPVENISKSHAIRERNQDLEIDNRGKAEEIKTLTREELKLKGKIKELKNRNEILETDSEFAGNAFKWILLLALAFVITNTFWGRKWWLSERDNADKKALRLEIRKLQDINTRGEAARTRAEHSERIIRKHAATPGLTVELAERLEQLIVRAEKLPDGEAKDALINEIESLGINKKVRDKKILPMTPA